MTPADRAAAIRGGFRRGRGPPKFQFPALHVIRQAWIFHTNCPRIENLRTDGRTRWLTNVCWSVDWGRWGRL